MLRNIIVIINVLIQHPLPALSETFGKIQHYRGFGFRNLKKSFQQYNSQ